MGIIIKLIFLILLSIPVNAQESVAVSKFIEAAAIQTGLYKEVEVSGKMLYIKLVPSKYTPYFDAGLTIGTALARQQIYLTKSWEF